MLPALSYGDDSTATSGSAEKEFEDVSYWAQAKKAYEGYKAGDVDLTEEAKRLIKEDIDRIGDWEYKVVAIDDADSLALEEALNALGEERWECFFVRESPNGKIQFYLKKQKVSYLQKASKADIAKMLSN